MKKTDFQDEKVAVLLCDRCKQAGVQNQVLVHEKYQELTQSMTQDDDDDF